MKQKSCTLKSEYILELIRIRGNISRTELSRVSGMGLPTVGKYVDDLLRVGKIVENGYEESSGGRRARLLTINPSFGPAIGIDMSGEGLRLSVVNLGGEVFSASEKPLKNGGGVSESIHELVSETLRSFPEVKSIGIASSGFVDYSSGISISSAHRGDVDNLPLRSYLEKSFSLPVLVDDVSRTWALVEKNLGNARQEKDFIFLFLDEGIGLSMCIDYSFYRGPIGISGEIGHFVIDENGPLCGCGNRGCLEVLASCNALVRDAVRSIQNGVYSSLQGREISIENVVAEAEKGDKLCYRLLTGAAERIGVVLAQVINLLGITTLVLGGRMRVGGQLLEEPIRRMVKTHSLSLLSRDFTIRSAHYGKEAGAMGAAILSLLELFKK